MSAKTQFLPFPKSALIKLEEILDYFTNPKNPIESTHKWTLCEGSLIVICELLAVSTPNEEIALVLEQLEPFKERVDINKTVAILEARQEALKTSEPQKKKKIEGNATSQAYQF